MSTRVSATKTPATPPRTVESEGARGARRRPGSGVMSLVLLGVTLAALGHVAVQAKQVEVGIDIGKENGIEKELRDRRRQLEIEIQQLKDVGRLTNYAKEKLKMVEVDSLSIIPVGKKEPARPAPATVKVKGGKS